MSDDYKALCERLRDFAPSRDVWDMGLLFSAADAIEALVAERDALHAENAELKVRLTKTERAMRLQKSRADDAEQELSDDKGNMSWEDATS